MTLGSATVEPGTSAAALPRQEDLVMERLVAAYFIAALTFLSISMLGGILMALQLVHWNPLNGVELLAPG